MRIRVWRALSTADFRPALNEEICCSSPPFAALTRSISLRAATSSHLCAPCRPQLLRFADGQLMGSAPPRPLRWSPGRAAPSQPPARCSGAQLPPWNSRRLAAARPGSSRRWPPRLRARCPRGQGAPRARHSAGAPRPAHRPGEPRSGPPHRGVGEVGNLRLRPLVRALELGEASVHPLQLTGQALVFLPEQLDLGLRSAMLWVAPNSSSSLAGRFQNLVELGQWRLLGCLRLRFCARLRAGPLPSVRRASPPARAGTPAGAPSERAAARWPGLRRARGSSGRRARTSLAAARVMKQGPDRS